MSSARNLEQLEYKGSVTVLLLGYSIDLDEVDELLEGAWVLFSGKNSGDYKMCAQCLK